MLRELRGGQGVGKVPATAEPATVRVTATLEAVMRPTLLTPEVRSSTSLTVALAGRLGGVTRTTGTSSTADCQARGATTVRGSDEGWVRNCAVA